MRKIVVVDDRSVFADALAAIFEDAHDSNEVSVCTRSEELVTSVQGAHLIVASYEWFSQLKEVRHRSVLLVVRSYNPRTEMQLLRGGASGVIPETATADQFASAAEQILAGNKYKWNGELVNPPATDSPRLTPREREIVQHVAGGLKNKEIADILHITAGTVKIHLGHIFEKTGLKDRFELAVHARSILGAEAEAYAPQQTT